VARGMLVVLAPACPVLVLLLLKRVTISMALELRVGTGHTRSISIVPPRIGCIAPHLPDPAIVVLPPPTPLSF
jgi:hypothetical protein